MKIVRWSACLFLAAAVLRAEVAAPTNVLLIIADDLNTALGAYGDPLAQTPNVDRLAARGVRFDRAHCQYPLCNPSRVSLFSGRRPEQTGVYTLNTGPAQAMPAVPRLPQHLRANGYFTAGAGKVYHSLATNDPASWDEYQDERPRDPQEQEALSFRQQGNGTPSWHELDGDGAETRDGHNARTIASHLRAQAASGRPFFLALGLHKPHLPWTAPRKYFERHPLERFALPPEPTMAGVPPIALQTELTGFAGPADVAAARRAYYACVSFIDEQVGLVLAELDRLDLWRNTVVILTADNGFHLGDHGGLWAKFSAYGAATRVPLILVAPGLPAGQVVSTPVELLDLYPTVMELTGVSAPAGLQGRSLLAAVKGAERDHAQSLVFHVDLPLRRNVAGRTLIGDGWRYTRWDERLGEKLYLHADDAGEYRNRATEPAQATLLQRARAAIDACPPPKPGPITAPRALLPPPGRKADGDK